MRPVTVLLFACLFVMGFAVLHIIDDAPTPFPASLKRNEAPAFFVGGAAVGIGQHELGDFGDDFRFRHNEALSDGKIRHVNFAVGVG